MRSIRLAVHADGSLVVSAGMSVPVAMIERLIEEKKEWIERHQARMRSRIFVAPRPSAEHYRM
jgi:predicted metal-dependent hydrolase